LILLSIQENKLPYPLEELEKFHQTLLEKNNDYKSMQSLQSAMSKSGEDGDMETKCNEIEFHLSVFLQSLSFFVRYELSSIVNIEVRKFRNLNPIYVHNNRTLAGQTIDNMNYIAKESQSFSDSHSVILIKNPNKLESEIDFISLSPFLLDKNALEGNTYPNLYYYTYQSEWYRFIFTSVEKSKEMEISKESMEEFEEKSIPHITYSRLIDSFEKLKNDFENAGKVGRKK
jgi:hypothetical protein